MKASVIFVLVALSLTACSHSKNHGQSVFQEPAEANKIIETRYYNTEGSEIVGSMSYIPNKAYYDKKGNLLYLIEYNRYDTQMPSRYYSYKYNSSSLLSKIYISNLITSEDTTIELTDSVIFNRDDKQ